MARSLDIWSVLIIISLAHSLFALNLLLVKKEYKSASGKWLIPILLLLFWFQLEFLAIRWPYDVGVNIFCGTRFGSWFLLGPLFYGYIQAVTAGSVNYKAFYHFLPFLIFSILTPLAFGDFLSYRQVHYGMLTPFDGRPDQINVIQYLYSGVFIAQFMHLGYFLTLSGKQIVRYRLSLQNSYSSISSDQLKWLQIMWYGMILILALSTLFLVLLFLTNIYRRHMDYLYVLPLSILVYVISYKLSGVQWAKPEIRLKYEKSGLKTEEVNFQKEEAYKVLNDRKLYLNQELKLKDLAEELGMKTHHLSELLNTHMNTSFFDLINRYRVEEAKARMASNPEFTLIQIAFDSGFNNKTSFVNAFKRFEGVTPSSYLKKSA